MNYFPTRSMTRIVSRTAVFSVAMSIAIITILTTSGCGGSNSSTCETLVGHFGSGARNAGHSVVLYSLTNCDGNGLNCEQHQADQTTVDSSGQFSFTHLSDGNYVAVLYDTDKATVLDQYQFNVPEICSGSTH